jgi:hypothetical protein
MIKKGRHLIKSHMTLEYDFTGVRIRDGYLVPVDWKLNVDLVATGKKGKAREIVECDASLTYQKIFFWLDTNLPNIVVVNVQNENDLYIANLSTNIMMYCPDIPGDDMLIQLLHSKISALAFPNLMVGELHLKGSDTALQYTYDCSEGSYVLPTTTEEYYTEGTTRDKTPWWLRDDGFCFEFVRPEDNKLTDEELFKDIMDPMDEFRRLVDEMSETPISILSEPAKIVQVEKWKPKKV